MTDILIMIVCTTVALGFLVLIHEGGHYAAARLFGVRVTELMLGLPGPNIGFRLAGTKFGITAVPLGGYARVCGMEAGAENPHLKNVLAALYRRGTATMEEIACDCAISDDEACEALDELVAWGSCTGPEKRDEYHTYRAPEVRLSSKETELRKHASNIRASSNDAVGQDRGLVYAKGQARPVDDPRALYESERAQQYRALPFWKRTVVLLAGIAVNLLFTILVFVVVYSFIGIDVQDLETDEIFHFNATIFQSIQAGIMYIGTVVQMVLSLFNPQTAAETVSNSTSIVGIAVMSKGWFEQGFITALEFMAMISVSLGIMNLLPIPPLDGGRLIVEMFQRLSRKTVSSQAMGYLTMAGIALFLGFFVIMLTQDIQRFVFGNWG